jgi:hypothetical protein
VRPVSLRQVKQWYERYRRVYYLGYELPPADSVKFEWTDMPGYHGETEPYEFPPPLRLNPEIRQHPRLVRMVLMHEMSHLAHPRAEHGPRWAEEAKRLGRLGAMREFF